MGLCLKELTKAGFQVLLLDGMDRRNDWGIFMGEGGGSWQVQASGGACVMFVDDHDLHLTPLFYFFPGMLEV